MTISFPVHGFSLQLHENEFLEIIIENTTVFSDIIADFTHQTNGDQGSLLISSGDRIHIFEKTVEFITNPFDIDFSTSRLQKKLLAETSSFISEQYTENLATLNQTMIDFWDSVLVSMPYNMKYDLSVDPSILAKSYNVSLNDDSTTIVEHLINYIKVVHQLLGKTVFIFLGIKQFLSQQELVSFLDSVKYENIFLANVSGYQSYSLPSEHLFIYDYDCCIIES